MNTIVLEWKDFQVNLDKVRDYFKTNLTSNYDGLVCDINSLSVVFKSDYSDGDAAVVNSYWNSITLASFNPTMNEIITQKIMDAITFGNNVILQATIENVALGITQAGKTKAVSDYLENLQLYLRTGSLYAALQEIDILINDPDRDSLGLDPFVNLDRLNEYKTKIQAYLAS